MVHHDNGAGIHEISYQLQISAIMIKYLIVRSCSGLFHGRAHGRPQEHLQAMNFPALQV
jgi:hypothetical protein